MLMLFGMRMLLLPVSWLAAAAVLPRRGGYCRQSSQGRGRSTDYGVDSFLWADPASLMRSRAFFRSLTIARILRKTAKISLSRSERKRADSASNWNLSYRISSNVIFVWAFFWSMRHFLFSCLLCLVLLSLINPSSFFLNTTCLLSQVSMLLYLETFQFMHANYLVHRRRPPMVLGLSLFWARIKIGSGWSVDVALNARCLLHAEPIMKLRNVGIWLYKQCSNISSHFNLLSIEADWSSRLCMHAEKCAVLISLPESQRLLPSCFFTYIELSEQNTKQYF